MSGGGERAEVRLGLGSVRGAAVGVLLILQSGSASEDVTCSVAESSHGLAKQDGHIFIL